MEIKKYRTLIFLQVLLFVYSLFGIFSKFAAAEEFLSLKFILFYGIVLLNLVIYAICWQQVIKSIPLVLAYANKAVTVIWGIVFGSVFFREEITFQKIVGAIVIIVGIVLIVTEQEKGND